MRKYEHFREWIIQDEERLVLDLGKTIGKQVLDLDLLLSTMREKDPNETDQISVKTVQEIIQNIGIQLDPHVIQRWIKAATVTADKDSCNISHLIDIMKRANNPLNDIARVKGQEKEN